MSVFNKFQGLLLLPIYYLIHKNLFFGFLHKKFIIYYFSKNFHWNLSIQ